MNPMAVKVGPRDATWVDTVVSDPGAYAVVVYADDNSVAMVQLYNLRVVPQQATRPSTYEQAAGR